MPESRLTCDKREKDTGFAHIITTKPLSPYEALLGIARYCDSCYDEEVRGRRPSSQTGEDLGKRRCRAESGCAYKLGDPMYLELTETSVQAHEEAVSSLACHSC